MPKKNKYRLEGAGWKFWLTSFTLFLGPALYGAWEVSYENVPIFAKILYGLIVAAMTASLLTWIVNSAFQYTVTRRRKEEKRRSKRKKKG